MHRTRCVVACLLPAVAIAAAWIQLEDPRRAGAALAVAAIALVPAFVARPWLRWVAAAGAAVVMARIAFEAEIWELLPFRDERVAEPVSRSVQLGLAGFYREFLPFDPLRNPEMHALTLAAILGFVAAVSILITARRPVAAAAVTVIGAGWPATLVDGKAVMIGALALAAALSIPLVLRVRTTPSLVAGAATAALVVGVAVWASPAATIAREAAIDWEAWDLGSPTAPATSVRYVWDANYDGIEFPRKPTVVLVVEGPDRARYWRASTLDLFTADRWFEDLDWLGLVEGETDAVPLDRLAPPQAARAEGRLEQRVEVRALVDNRLVATGTPVALDVRQVGPVFVLSGGVLRAGEAINRGGSYRVWSHAPDPAPATLARSRPRYPRAAEPYLAADGRQFPPFGAAGREFSVRRVLADPAYALVGYERLYDRALRVAGRARSPYEAVLLLESWFRQRGGFLYDEQPPRGVAAPLVDFVTRTKAGYCQHYAGAMALMLRMLGIPARVAVGFTSGTRDDARWVVTDRDAHAWVEVWFAGQGWVTFDPTPGRGTFGGTYSFASDSAEAVAALSRGELGEEGANADRLGRGTEATLTGSGQGRRAPSPYVAALALVALWVGVIGGGKALRRRAGRLTRDPRRAATASRRELEGYLRDQGIAIPSGSTLEDLKSTVGRELGLDAGAFTAAVARARFGPPGKAGQEAFAPRRELQRLLRAIRLQLSGWSRFRGLVSLRSLQRSGQR